MKSESAIVWEGQAVFVTHDSTMAAALGPYAICVKGATHAIIVGRTEYRDKAMSNAQRLDRYPANARSFAGIL